MDQKVATTLKVFNIMNQNVSYGQMDGKSYKPSIIYNTKKIILTTDLRENKR